MPDAPVTAPTLAPTPTLDEVDTMSQNTQAPVFGPHERRCHDCGNVAMHADGITPHVLCGKCGSQDTRRTKHPAPPPSAQERPRLLTADDVARIEEEAVADFAYRGESYGGIKAYAACRYFKQLCESVRAYAAAAHSVAPASGQERGLRELLLLRHGCSLSEFYTDDGELQCNRCQIDFLRASVSEISDRFVDINYRKYGDYRLLPPEPTQSPPPPTRENEEGRR